MRSIPARVRPSADRTRYSTRSISTRGSDSDIASERRIASSSCCWRVVRSCIRPVHRRRTHVRQGPRGEPWSSLPPNRESVPASGGVRQSAETLVRRVKPPVRRIVRAVGKVVNVRRDASTGLLYERCFGRRVLSSRIRTTSRNTSVAGCATTCTSRRTSRPAYDVVVDVGAGDGHEGATCTTVRRVRYIGVEIQPIVDACLSNTIGPHRPHLVACPFALARRRRCPSGSRC